jgi:hypothetical protein
MKKYLPNNQDTLFKDENDSNYGSWLQNPDNKFFLYSEGYKKAGEQLYDLCITNSFYLNTIIYPLVFNYRQFVELRLKELILMGYKYLNKPNDFADEHSLIKLWNTYKNEILPLIDTIDQAIIINVERIISQFNSEDPDSMSFRYPVSRGPIREKHIKRNTIDLKNFKKVIDKLIYFFDWQWDNISHYQDLKDELIADMYREYY